MSRRRKKQHHGRFIALEHGLMNSPAYQALTGDALKLLLALWKRHNGENNGEISFSTREAAELLRGNKNTAAKRFAELQELGFLAVEQKGAFSVKLKRATLWRITSETCKGRPPTRDYQHWRPAPTVSPAITESRTEKQNTVSPRDTHGTPERYRDGQKPRKKVVSVSPRDTVNGHSDPSTVSRRGTHIELAIGSAFQNAPPDVRLAALLGSDTLGLAAPAERAARARPGSNRSARGRWASKGAALQ
jgi:hypothetical protein